MPRNFLTGCSAAETLREDLPDLTEERLDQLVTQAGITPDSDPEELKFLQQTTGIDSIAAVEAAEAAEDCNVCEHLSQCALGTFLSTKL
jgi:hypothetical protein